MNTSSQPSLIRRLFRSLKLHYFRMTNPATIQLHGVLINTAKQEIPRSVRDQLFKEKYEEFECELVKEIVGNDDRVLEIGTGIGLVSLVATKLAGEGNVLSYEANPELEKTITANYALNAIKPNLRMKAVTLEGGDLTFYQNANIISSSMIDRNLLENKITVKSDPFNKILEDYKPKVLIMDVEGAEVALLNNSKLETIESIIVEMHPHIVGEKEISDTIDNLVSLGFKMDKSRHKTYLLTRNLGF